MPNRREDHEYLAQKILSLYFEQNMTSTEIVSELKQDPMVKSPVTLSVVRNTIHRHKKRGENKIHKWDPKDDPKLVTMYLEGIQISHIAAIFDKSPATVQKRIRQLGMTNRKITESQKAVVENEIRLGRKNMVEISIELGLSYEAVRHVSNKLKQSSQDLRKFNPGFKYGSTFERSLRKPLTELYGDAVLPKEHSRDWSSGRYEIDLPIDFRDGHKFAIELNHVRTHAYRQHQDYRKRALARELGWVWITIWYDRIPDKALVKEAMETVVKIVEENYAGEDNFYKEYLEKVEVMERKFYMPDQPPDDPKGNVNFGSFWSEQEEDILRDNWGKKNIDELVTMLPGRTAEAIYHKARQWGLTKKHPNYSATEDQILIEHYSKLSDEELMELLPGRSADSIRTRASRLELKKESLYTEAEDNFLRQFYAASTDEEMQKLLPGRSIESIKSRAYHLRLMKQSRWTSNEKQKLRDLYPEASRAEIMAALPGRTWQAIISKASSMKIHRLTPFD